jgi:hypothetical protein
VKHLFRIGVNEDRSLTDLPLENFEGSLLVFGPVPFVILLKPGVERFCHVGKPWDPAVVKIDETDELADATPSSLLLFEVEHLEIPELEPEEGALEDLATAKLAVCNVAGNETLSEGDGLNCNKLSDIKAAKGKQSLPPLQYWFLISNFC